jgi:hypothetical protein
MRRRIDNPIVRALKLGRELQLAAERIQAGAHFRVPFSTAAARAIAEHPSLRRELAAASRLLGEALEAPRTGRGS